MSYRRSQGGTRGGELNVCRNLEYETQIRSKLGEDGIDSEEKVLLKKVADCVAKTELELTTYQQCEGIFTKATVVSNAKAMASAQWCAYGD